MVDPGEESERVITTLRELGSRCVAVLVTHGHLDHIGAVGAVARDLACPVYASAGDAATLTHINDHLWPGVGPYVAHKPEGLLAPGEALDLVGISIAVLATPGHHPDAVSMLLTGPEGDQLLISGDVVFAGSVGRTDLAGGDWPTLEKSIALLIAQVGEDVPVLPGHGPRTTLRHERATNPFLAGLCK